MGMQEATCKIRPPPQALWMGIQSCCTITASWVFFAEALALPSNKLHHEQELLTLVIFMRWVFCLKKAAQHSIQGEQQTVRVDLELSLWMTAAIRQWTFAWLMCSPQVLSLPDFITGIWILILATECLSLYSSLHTIYFWCSVVGQSFQPSNWSKTLFCKVLKSKVIF